MLSIIAPFQLDEVKKFARNTPPEGIIVEVGVYKGGSALELMSVAKERNQELWLFDTFEGMPEAIDIDYHKVGEFGDCSYEAVKALVPDAKIFKGFFPATWIPIEPKKQISFAHIDCDQYTSISECIKHFSPYMLKGGIMWFDDFGVAHLPSATKAVNELLPNRLIHPLGRAYFIF